MLHVLQVLKRNAGSQRQVVNNVVTEHSKVMIMSYMACLLC